MLSQGIASEGERIGMNEVTKVDVRYGAVRTRDVAAPYAPVREAPADSRRWALLRRLLQLDHKLWRNTLLRRLLAASDAIAIVVAISLLSALSHGTPFWLIAFVPIWLVLAKTYGLYDRDHRAMRHLTIDEVPALLVWVL